MKIRILTREINDYNQDGAYFEAVFKDKPTDIQLRDIFKKHGINHDDWEFMYEHVRNGGGRVYEEGTWFYLEEIDLDKT
jgi:hypothetical protein